MHIISLKKLVEDNNVNEVSVFVGEGVSNLSFEVGSPEYREYENYLVKGEYAMKQDPTTGKIILGVNRLEKELNLELNHPEVEVEMVAGKTEEDIKIDDHVNTKVTAVVFHRDTLRSAGRDTEIHQVTAYAQAMLESYRKNFGEADLKDFAVIEVDWWNRTIALKSIAEVPPESTEEA